MPEGDVVFRTATRLSQALTGRTLLAAELRWPGLSTAELTGSTVDQITCYGKHLLIRLDSGWTLHSHLRMDGSWWIEATGHPVPWLGVGRRPVGRAEPPARWRRADVRAVLASEQWSALGLDLGMLNLVPTPREAELIGHLGPDILAADLDLSEPGRLLAERTDPVGAALLDQRLVAGIGTVWSSESLFLEGLWPWQPSDRLDPVTASRLLERARRLMSANLRHPVQTSTGNRRRGFETYVHARAGKPCRRCGGPVAVAPIGPPTRERPMFHCPQCQVDRG